MLAVLESWTMARVLPALFKQLVSTIGAEYDFASDEYVVACSAVKGLPDLVLTLKGGFEYRIPAREYVKNVSCHILQRISWTRISARASQGQKMHAAHFRISLPIAGKRKRYRSRMADAQLLLLALQLRSKRVGGSQGKASLTGSYKLERSRSYST